MSRIDLVTVLILVVLALALVATIWPWQPPDVVTVREPTQTPWVIVVTATPRAVEAGPPTTKTATPLSTVTGSDRLPTGSPIPTRTATVVVPPTPDWLPSPLPSRSPVQRGNHAPIHGV